ncbi:hypothetical protein NDU88_004179 [Pleurodeles waltl]|uniref:Uncharacterized protein n=1 Tax=Pleurodeles waltl TaxID=8319 RepID=A0AAV7VJH9_PLEWA|nr:hypothetical protein NDU88_004179 [Pleurodeles waltl]
MIIAVRRGERSSSAPAEFPAISEKANQGSLPATKAGLRGVEMPVVVRRRAGNGGAVSSGAGGRNRADQRKQEDEEETVGKTDFSASQEA